MKPRSARSKIFSEKETAALSSARKNKKLVFTNGCFDLLHKGHTRYLEEARACGDLLLVALNSDDSVKRLKGPARPTHPLADRMEVLAALECVDFVTSFDEDTPLKLIQKIQPDVLVKGGDWKPEQIVGGPEVLSWGGQVLSLHYHEGNSTTNILKKIFAAE